MDGQEFSDQTKKETKTTLPGEKKQLPLKKASNIAWWKIISIIVAVLALAYVAAAVVGGIGIYKYRWENKFTDVMLRAFPYPAALVGSDLITMQDLNKEIGYIKYFYEKTAPDQMPDISLIQKQVVDRLVQSKVIAKLARENGVSVDSKEVDEQFKKIADENGGEEKVKQILSDLYGLDISTFKRLIKEQLLQEKLREKFENDLQMQVKAKHILIKVAPDATPEVKEAARVKAQDILNQIKNGADFSELAKQQSQDEASAGQGGELPWFSKGQMVKEFEEAAFGMDPGSVSELVLTPYGFHIIKVDEKKGSTNMTFDEWLQDSEKKFWTFRFVGRKAVEEPVVNEEVPAEEQR